jgi:hypothetical protein
MSRLSCFSLLVLLLSACNGPRDVRDYYFPVRDLDNNGLVYAYENTGTLPGPDTEYSYYLGVDVDTALYLSVTHYDPALQPRQQSREEIRNDGVYLREVTLLRTDSSGIATPIPTTLLYNKVFPFYLEDASVTPYGYRMSFNDPEQPGVTNYVTLNRRYLRDTTFVLQEKEYPALLFSLEGEVSLRDPEEGDISPQFRGYEIYAEGIGLVAYRRELGADGAALGGRLLERVGMQEFLDAKFD